MCLTVCLAIFAAANVGERTGHLTAKSDWLRDKSTLPKVGIKVDNLDKIGDLASSTLSDDAADLRLLLDTGRDVVLIKTRASSQDASKYEIYQIPTSSIRIISFAR